MTAWLVLAPLGAVLSLNLHELTHCLVIWLIGGSVTQYRPYPHKVDGKWWIGRMRWVMSRPRTRAETRWFYGAIPLRAAAFLALWLLLGLFVYRPLLALAFWDLIDLGDWVKDYLWKRESQDGGKFRAA